MLASWDGHRPLGECCWTRSAWNHDHDRHTASVDPLIMAHVGVGFSDKSGYPILMLWIGADLIRCLQRANGKPPRTTNPPQFGSKHSYCSHGHGTIQINSDVLSLDPTYLFRSVTRFQFPSLVHQLNSMHVHYLGAMPPCGYELYLKSGGHETPWNSVHQRVPKFTPMRPWEFVFWLDLSFGWS